MGNIHPVGLEFLDSTGIGFLEITNFDRDNLISQLSEVNGIVLRTASLNKDVLSHCKNLKIVSRHGVGYDNVDSKFLNQNRIALGITGTSNAVSVAEHVMTMFLTITKRMNDYNNLVKSGNFKKKK